MLSTSLLTLLAQVLYLQDYLLSCKNTCLIVSHDRGFLNAVCSDIVLLNGKKLAYYKVQLSRESRISTQLTHDRSRSCKHAGRLRCIRADGERNSPSSTTSL